MDEQDGQDKSWSYPVHPFSHKVVRMVSASLWWHGKLASQFLNQFPQLLDLFLQILYFMILLVVLLLQLADRLQHQVRQLGVVNLLEAVLIGGNQFWENQRHILGDQPYVFDRPVLVSLQFVAPVERYWLQKDQFVQHIRGKGLDVFLQSLVRGAGCSDTTAAIE